MPTTSSPHRIELNILTGQRISPDLLMLEPQLNRTKWFDYRFMTAAEATQLFADEYMKSYSRVYEQTRDINEAKNKFGLSKKKIFDNKNKALTSLWKARQAADRLGVPYGFFTIYGYKYLMEDRIYKHIPLANQLYSEVTIEAVKRKWEEHKFEVGYHTNDPRYKNVNYRDHPAQNAYHDYQIKYIKSRPVREFSIGNFCSIYETLLISRAKSEFGDAMVDSAIDRACGKDGEYKEVDTTDFRLSCFSVPHAFDSSQNICSECDLCEICKVESKLVLNRIVGICGVEDPVNKRRKEIDRDRQRRRRERLRAEKNVVADAG